MMLYLHSIQNSSFYNLKLNHIELISGNSNLLSAGNRQLVGVCHISVTVDRVRDGS